jgi:eukaryotic-like serine/threonine-protein kinase
MDDPSPGVDRNRSTIGLRPAEVRPDSSMSPSAIGPYAVLHELGRGAMGIVHACYDPRLDRLVAVKILRTDRSSPKVRRRLVSEARAMAKLNHPNVAHVYEVGEANGHVFVAMEYIHGKTLREWARVRRHGWREALGLAVAAARGLAAAHAAGLVHRDFKPDNVMVSDDGRVRVMDFGLARFEEEATLERDSDVVVPKASGSTLTQRGAVLGTPLYMAPEQIWNPQGSFAADQFAFCVTVWELLFGTRPFAGSDLEALDADVHRARPDHGVHGGAVPRWLRKLLERGLSHSPDGRHASMPALLRALERGSSQIRRRRVAFGAACVGVAALGYAGVAAFDRDRRTQACHDSAQAWIASVDEGPQRAALAGLRAIVSPVAEATAHAVGPFLAAQADALEDAFASACILAEVERTGSADLDERGAWCLDEHRSELLAVLQAFARADVDLLVDAVDVVSSLEQVGRCLDEDALLGTPLPPADRRAATLALQTDLTREGVLLQTSADDRVKRLSALGPEVDALDWDPLRARLQFQIGRAAWLDVDIEAADRMLVDAYFIAVESRDWTTAAHASISLIELEGRWMRRRDEGLAWGEHAAVALEKAADRFGLREVSRRKALATVHHVEGDSLQARVEIEAVRAIIEPLLPENHPVIADNLDMLGALAHDSGDYDTMIASCERALRTYESVLGKEHRKVEYTLLNLGVAFADTGSYARARAIAERALAIAERVEPPGSLIFASHQALLGTVATGMGDHAQARLHLERAIAIREEVLGANHWGVGRTRRTLGLSLLEAGDLHGAREQLERSLATAEAVLGVEHHEVGESLLLLSGVHSAAGAHAIAGTLRARGIAILVTTAGEGSLDHADALEAEAAGLRAQGELERAREVVRRVLALHEHNLGAEHQASALMLAELGAIELDLGNAAAAREHLGRAVDLFAGHVVFRDAEHVASFALARALEATGGDRVRARALATQARDGWREVHRAKARQLAEVEAWLQEHPLP